MLLHRRLTLNSARQRRDRSFQSYQGLNWLEAGFKCYFHVALPISQLSLETLHACPSIFVFYALYEYIKPCSASHPVWLYSLFSSSGLPKSANMQKGNAEFSLHLPFFQNLILYPGSFSNSKYEYFTLWTYDIIWLSFWLFWSLASLPTISAFWVLPWIGKCSERINTFGTLDLPRLGLPDKTQNSCNIWDVLILKNCLFFIWNSNVAGHPIFLVAKSAHPFL